MTEMNYDVVIAGSGPTGSTLASYLSISGHSVLIVEKETFPRFAIGESLLPFSNEIFKEIGFFDKIENGDYIKKFGAHFLKISTGEEAYFDFTDEGYSKWGHSYEVERGKFDLQLQEHAISLGAKLLSPEIVKEVSFQNNDPLVKTSNHIIKCKYFVDCTGRNSSLNRLFSDVEPVESYNNKTAIFSHFENISRKDHKHEGDILILDYSNQEWMWFIPFKNGVTSVGLVSSSEKLKKYSGNLEQALIDRFSQNDKVLTKTKNSKILFPPRLISNYSRAASSKVGKNWMLVGDAGHFLDPVFSSGVHLGLVSAKLASEKIHYSLKNDIPLNDENHPVEYCREIEKGVNRFHNLLQIFYSNEFFPKINNILRHKNSRSAIISAVSGGMWEEDNTLFRVGVL